MGRLAKSITRIKTKIRETRLLLRTRFQDKLQARLAFLDLRQAEKSLNTLKTKKNIHLFKIDYLRSIFRDRQSYTDRAST